MSKLLQNYLDQVMTYANRAGKDAETVRDELQDHLETSIEARVEAGESREDAIYEAVLANGDAQTVGYKLRPRFPLIDIRSEGVARGVVAIGPRAIGIFACGGASLGVISFGGASFGLISLGGLALGLFSWGGLALGLLAFGGFAAGAVAFGGFAMGLLAIGGGVFALWAPKYGNGYSHYTSANVPEYLLALENYLHGLYAMGEWMGLIMAFYMVLLGLTTYAQTLEKKRVQKQRKVI